MEDGADWSFELVTVVLVLALTLPFFASSINKLMNSDYWGFDSPIVEKTAMRTAEEINPTKRVVDRNDIMLMLAVADKYVRDPIQYDINGYVFNIDDTYFSNRNTILTGAFAAMDVNPKKFVLYYGMTGPRKWRIENE